MTLRIVRTRSAPDAIGPYSQGVVFGQLLFTAGQIPLDPRTRELVPGDIVTQTEQVMANLTAILASAGASWMDVLKTTAFLVDMKGYAQFNEVYARHLGLARPARSTVEVSALPRGALLQVDAIAAIPITR